LKIQRTNLAIHSYTYYKMNFTFFLSHVMTCTYYRRLGKQKNIYLTENKIHEVPDAKNISISHHISISHIKTKHV